MSKFKKGDVVFHPDDPENSTGTVARTSKHSEFLRHSTFADGWYFHESQLRKLTVSPLARKLGVRFW